MHIASSHAFIHTCVFSVSIRLCRLRSLHTVEHSVYRGACEFSTWGACLPSPPEAFLGTPFFQGVNPFLPFGVPPFLSLP